MRTAFLALLVLAVAAVAYSQGRIAGRVVDTLGQGIPDASVTATAQNGCETTAVTGGKGEYEIPDLTAGEYGVAVRMAGFITAQERAQVNGATVTLRHELKVGSTGELLCSGVWGLAAPGVSGLSPTAADTGPGLAAAWRLADAVVHLRVEAATETRPCPLFPNRNEKAGIANDPPVLAGDPCFRHRFSPITRVRWWTFAAPDSFFYAGRLAPGQEFVAFLTRSASTSDIEPLACGLYMIPVKQGRVAWTPSGERNVDGMVVHEFLVKLEAIPMEPTRNDLEKRYGNPIHVTHAAGAGKTIDAPPGSAGSRSKPGEPVSETYQASSDVAVTATCKTNGEFKELKVGPCPQPAPASDTSLTPVGRTTFILTIDRCRHVIDDLVPEATRGAYRIGGFNTILGSNSESLVRSYEDYQKLVIEYYAGGPTPPFYIVRWKQ
jgi:hypothetical protein